MSGNATNQALRPNRDKFSFKMLSFDDNRWEQLLGGYRTQFDPRAAFSKLESNIQCEDAWDELWEGLHHQGDVGEASYAAVASHRANLSPATTGPLENLRIGRTY